MARIVGQRMRVGSVYTKYTIVTRTIYDTAAIRKLQHDRRIPKDLTSEVLRKPLEPHLALINQLAHQLNTKVQRREIAIADDGTITQLKGA